MTPQNAISVRQLNLYVKSLIEGDTRLSYLTVTGEISNFKKHYSSGHWYFTLKDADASVKCVMFRSSASRVRADIADGMSVIIRGRVSLYEKDGQYQLYADEMMPEGLGDLALKFEQVKAKLSAEGLFNAENKRPLPKFPKRIAVVTSSTGAAVQDILNITERRYPVCEVVLCPVSVQGELAVGEMLDALDRLYKLSDIDLIIIGRGGGSAEDLAAFNDEMLARKIYESPFPVISAVGHETDFSICDFVADMRAPTPSAAAEIAVPDVMQLLITVKKLGLSAARALNENYKLCRARLDKIMASRYLKYPLETVDTRMQQLDRVTERLVINAKGKYEGCSTDFINLTSKLDALSPLKVMARGFAAVQKDGCIVNNIDDVAIGDKIKLNFSNGSADCLVEEIEYGNPEN